MTAETPWGMVFDGPGRKLNCATFARPKLAPGECLVRVLGTTLCGSDLHSYEGRRLTPVPTILGHEILGEIEELPTEPPTAIGGRPLAVGDRVVWGLAASCGMPLLPPGPSAEVRGTVQVRSRSAASGTRAERRPRVSLPVGARDGDRPCARSRAGRDGLPGGLRDGHGRWGAARRGGSATGQIPGGGTGHVGADGLRDAAGGRS